MEQVNCGSEWKKWDLHVHTPASFHWNGKKFIDMSNEEIKSSIKEMIDKINSSDIAAYSIMDYFTFDGFTQIRNFLRDNPEVKINKTIFPGIELRIEAPVDYRLNIHAIFQEDIKHQELEDFKSTLKIFGSDDILSRESIIKAAKKLPPDKAETHIGNKDYKNNDDVAFELGIKTIKITRESFDCAVKKLTKEKCLIILPFDTNDGISKLDWRTHSHEACYFFQLADIFEARKKESIDLILNIKTPGNQDFINNFFETMGKKSKPAISGSDSHKISDYGNYPNSRITWIKAEPTFKGLRKTLVEPQDRTYVGEKPEKLKIVSNNATKFISGLEIKKNLEEKFDEIWFNNSISFNFELIAIIGNKGSGKSALADIIGLLGNSRNEKAFSFLNDKKFREKQNYKAGKYSATMHWRNGTSHTKLLSDEIDCSAVELVKYIPQSYLEKLCNEITLEKSLFDLELKTVIFSHISEDHRLGQSSLDELIKYKTEEINREISSFRESLFSILQEIINNENKQTKQYEQSIVNQLTSKQTELTAHENSKPIQVLKPINDDNTDLDNQKLLQELESQKINEQELCEIVAQRNTGLEALRKRKSVAEKILQQLDFIEKQNKQNLINLEILLKEIGITSFNEIISITINRSSITEIIEKINSDITSASAELDPENTDGALQKLNKTQERIKELSYCIDEPNRKYQAYLEELEIWNKTLVSIKGDSNKPGTINYLNLQLAEIQNIPEKIKELERKRDFLVEQIFSMITKLADIYKQLYLPVQHFVESNPFSDDAFNMSFNVSIIDTGFRNTFFQKLNRSRIGSFHGTEESEKMLDNIYNKYNFNEKEDVINFTREIMRHLKFDCRDDKKIPVNISTQIKGEVLDAYKFIFSLEYLEPKYLLTLNKKSLGQLSPGERGTLLLVFYLMVDKDDRPLILDQPEENLDNQTIFKVLVPCIKSVKKKRQLFLVTHNPNLAIVCDAEQIIVTSIDKSSKNAVKYHCGAIENQATNKLIVDVLEGTHPAFDNRKSKYFFNIEEAEIR